MPVETSLSMQNAEEVNMGSRPIIFWVITGKPYTLEFTAAKYIGGILGEMEMNIFLPDEIKRIEGSLSWIGKEQSNTIYCTIQSEIEGEFLVEGEATNYQSGFKTISRIRVISTKSAEKARQMNEQLKKEQSSIPCLEPEVIIDANPEKTPQVNVPENYAHLAGIVYTYEYSNGYKYMLEGIRVELWEETDSGSTLIKAVYTKDPPNGESNDFGLTPTNYIYNGQWHHPDDAGRFDFGNIYVGNGKDLFYKVMFVYHSNADGISESGVEKLRVINDADPNDSVVSALYVAFHATSGMDRFSGLWMPHLGHGSVEDEATHIFYDIVKAFGYFRDQLGYTHSNVTAKIYYPDDSSPNCSGYTINFNGWTNDYLIYEDTDSIVHEYSHSIHYGMRGGSFPPYSSGDSNHGNCDNVTSSDGLIEGWARFVPCVINQDNIYDWHSGGQGQDIEPNTGDCDTPPHNAATDRHEWTVGAILWDLHREIGDEHMWFYRIARTLRLDDPDYVEDFFWGFIDDWGHNQEVWQIFFNHNVNYDNTAPIITDVNRSPLSPTSSDNVHIYANVTDDLSGVEYVKCWYKINNGNYYSILMTQQSGNTYRTSSPISLQPAGTTVTYYIRARDAALNHRSSSTYQYVVQQGPPELYVYPTSHDFGTMNQGQTDSWIFYIENSGGGTLSWNVSESLSWISVGPLSGSITTETENVTVTIDTTGLALGQHYDGYISVTSNGGNTQVYVEVTIAGGSAPQLYVYPTSHDFGTMNQGQTDSWIFYIENSGGGTLSWNVSESLSWISVGPLSGSITTETENVTVTIDTTGLALGQHYDGYISVTSNGGNTQVYVEVTIAESTSNIQFSNYSAYDYSYGNGDGIVNPGEYVDLIVYLENTGTQTIYDVSATASTTSPYINASSAYSPYLTPYFGDIPAGDISGGYIGFMLSNAPDGTIITFDLTITDLNGNIWYDSFDVIVTGTDTLAPRTVTLQTSSQVFNVGNTVNIVAFVEEGDDMSSGSVIAQIESSNKAVVAEIGLYDDGMHNDFDAGDRFFGGYWTVTQAETDYVMSILTSDNSGNSAEWIGLTGFTTKTFTVSNKILVVDDDNNNLVSWVTAAAYQTYYTVALDSNGLSYDIWDYFFRGSPDSCTLTQYDIVIWLTGDTYGEWYFSQGYFTETLSSADQANLIAYLESGGNLFICGQDIGYDLYWRSPDDQAFYKNYLHANFVQDAVNLYGVHSVTGNSITDSLYLNISGGDGANNQFFASEIDPINGATTIFTYDPAATMPQSGLLQAAIQKRKPFEREQEIMQIISKGQLPRGIVSSGSAAISVDTGAYKVVYFAFGFEAIDNPADRNIIMRKVIQWLHGAVEGSLPQLFNTNSYLVVGDDAYCTDVLGTAKISYGLALGGASENPEGRTDLLLTTTEHDTGNLIIVGGPAVNPIATEFDNIFGITYDYSPGVSLQINAEGESIYLDLQNYPEGDICIVYLGEHNGRNVILVWGYGWQGTYAGSAFMGNPANWQAYEGANMLMMRWVDLDADGLVQMSEIVVEKHKQPLTVKTVIRGIVNWIRGTADWVLSLLFNTNSYLVVGDDAYCTDVLGTAKISYGLALGGASENPEGRTDLLLTTTEHDTGNLIIVGGPAVNPIATEFDNIFGITYDYSPGVSLQINAEGESIYLDLQNYPEGDICIVYLGEHNGRNVILVWGYGWQGTYAGSVSAGDPGTWQTYANAHMLMLRWIDSNGDGLVQKSEIIVEKYV